MTSSTFPKNFVWGAATSAYQIEGAWDKDGKSLSVWDMFSHTPGKIANNENGDIANDHYHRFKDDIRLMADIGLKAYRFSTAWTRILPEGTGRVNRKGVGFYDRLVDELLKHKIEPYICLFHWDLPQVLQDKGGWQNRETAYAFAEYAGLVSARLTDRVKYWFTHNEPWVAAILGYFTGEHAPGIKNPAAGMEALHHLLLSHGLAMDAIRAEAKKPVKIGITLNLNPVYPATETKRDRDAASRMDTILNRSVLDPLFKGTSPIQELGLGRLQAKSLIRSGDLEKIRRLDMLGVNYYCRTVAKYDARVPVVAASQVYPEGNEYSGMWEIYPKGIYEILFRIWKDYKPSCDMMITENGIPVPDGLDFDNHIRDERRIRYLHDHLIQVQRAIKAGVPVKGYFHWSLMDNFEWAFGYGPRFGLVYVDYKTQKRTIKDSGRWFGRVVEKNRIDD
jgi:beta-glucosidase